MVGHADYFILFSYIPSKLLGFVAWGCFAGGAASPPCLGIVMGLIYVYIWVAQKNNCPKCACTSVWGRWGGQEKMRLKAERKMILKKVAIEEMMRLKTRKRCNWKPPSLATTTLNGADGGLRVVRGSLDRGGGQLVSDAKDTAVGCDWRVDANAEKMHLRVVRCDCRWDAIEDEMRLKMRYDWR